MTSKIGSAAAAKTVQKMAGTSGLNSSLAALTQSGHASEPIVVRTQNVSAELAEKAGAVKYPAVNVFVQKIVNDQREKFRKFSGRVQLAVEVRHSQDHLEGLEDKLQTLADAVANTLQGSAGDWGDGMFYGGGYEIAFGPVKHGGRNFVQPATITFALDVSK